MGGGCRGVGAGVNGRLVKAVEMAARRLTSLCPASKPTVGSGCGNAPASLPARPWAGWTGWGEWRTDGPREQGDEQRAGLLRMGFQIPIWTYGSSRSCGHQVCLKL